jgi:hypothetical protein
MMDYASKVARDINHGGLLHWGQRNDSTEKYLDRFFASTGELARWRDHLAALTGGGRMNRFSNDQTRKWGLEVRL